MLRTAVMTLHERLLIKQSDEELRRKERKSSGRHTNNFWSQEELDMAHREAERLAAYFAQNFE